MQLLIAILNRGMNVKRFIELLYLLFILSSSIFMK